jgi:hypothetical protein
MHVLSVKESIFYCTQDVGIGATRCFSSIKKIGALPGQMEGIDFQSPTSRLGTKKSTRYGGPKNQDFNQSHRTKTMDLQ